MQLKSSNFGRDVRIEVGLNRANELNQCLGFGAKLGQELPGMVYKPFNNDLGQRIYDNVSQDAWKQWIEASKMIVNEYRLDLTSPQGQKLLMEQAITVGSSVWWEAQQRGDRFGRELDLVAVNTLSLCAANAAAVWMVSPDRSFGAPHKMPWQKMLHSLPNNIFDMSGPQRAYTTGSRAASLFAKAAELSAVGVLSGAAMTAGQRALTAIRRRGDPNWQPAVRTPELRNSSLGMAASMGLFANGRYQIISGVDRYLFGHSNYLMSYLIASGIVRIASNRFGEPTRLTLQGLPVSAPRRSPQRTALPSAAGRQTAASQPVRTTKRAKGSRKGKKKAPKGFEMSAAVVGA